MSSVALYCNRLCLSHLSACMWHLSRSKPASSLSIRSMSGVVTIRDFRHSRCRAIFACNRPLIFSPQPNARCTETSNKIIRLSYASDTTPWSRIICFVVACCIDLCAWSPPLFHLRPFSLSSVRAFLLYCSFLPPDLTFICFLAKNLTFYLLSLLFI